jgi:phosphotransferase system enzyme I (PtsP)
MLKAIAHVIAEGRRVNRPVNLCGEMPADPGAAVLLLGLGVDSLSAGAVSVPKVKWAIRSFTLTDARNLAQQALTLETVGEVRQLLNNALCQVGLSEIVRDSV